VTSKTFAQAAIVAAQLLLVVASAHAGEPPVVNIPEPMTLSLLGAGAAVAAVGAWWRNRK
jgi:hypothetical protein